MNKERAEYIFINQVTKSLNVEDIVTALYIEYPNLFKKALKELDL